jgi:hypothetical protein
MGEADTGFFKVRFIDSPLSNFEIIMIYGTGSCTQVVANLDRIEREKKGWPLSCPDSSMFA